MDIVAGDFRYRLRITEETSARWTFRLALELTGPGLDHPMRWTDRAKRNVEDDLGQVLDEIASNADAARREAAEREQAEAQRLAEQQEKALRKYRAKVLRKQVKAWRQATSIRRHCDELIAGGLSPEDEWVRWARSRADEVDPLTDPPGLPDPADPDDTADDEPEPVAPSPFAGIHREIPKPWHPNRRWWDR